MTDNTSDTDSTERAQSDELELTIPLDDAHAEMVAQLRAAGVPVEQAVRQQVQATVDEALHSAFLASKYGEQ